MIQDYANETFEAQELVVYAKALLRNHDFLRKLDQFLPVIHLGLTLSGLVLLNYASYLRLSIVAAFLKCGDSLREQLMRLLKTGSRACPKS